MSEHRIVILGNSGSGKSTLARKLALERELVHLDVDEIAWHEPGERLPLDESIKRLEAFQDQHLSWVVEGSYASLAEAALLRCTEFLFLNPGVARCVEYCLQRPWEPHKYDSPEEQNKVLEFLLDWVRQYETRDDDYGLKAHRAVFEAFDGQKRELD